MKLLQFLGLVVGFLSISQLAFSHGECKNRSDCNWTVNTPWQYKAKARCSKFGIPSSTTDLDCPYNGGDGYAYAYKNNGCAWQSAANNYGSWTFGGSVYKNKRICARGFSSSDLYYDIVSIQPEDLEDYEKSTIKTSPTLFKSDHVAIESIHGFLEAKGSDLFSSFEIKMWLPTSPADETITAEKTFFAGKVELYNGQLIVTGDFPKNAFELVETAPGVHQVIFKDWAIKATLPEGVNGETDLIEVVGISDGGVHEANVLSATLLESAQQQAFTVSPNPTASVVNISLETVTNDNYSIRLYDLSGQEIALIAPQVAATELKQYSINLESFNLTNGTYFLLLQSKEHSHLQKIVYQE